MKKEVQPFLLHLFTFWTAAQLIFQEICADTNIPQHFDSGSDNFDVWGETENFLYHLNTILLDTGWNMSCSEQEEMDWRLSWGR